MMRGKLSKDTRYRVYAINGELKHRKILQKMVDDVEEYARKYKLTLKIEWEE